MEHSTIKSAPPPLKVHGTGLSAGALTFSLGAKVPRPLIGSIGHQWQGVDSREGGKLRGADRSPPDAGGNAAANSFPAVRAAFCCAGCLLGAATQSLSNDVVCVRCNTRMCAIALHYQWTFPQRGATTHRAGILTTNHARASEVSWALRAARKPAGPPRCSDLLDRTCVTTPSAADRLSRKKTLPTAASGRALSDEREQEIRATGAHCREGLRALVVSPRSPVRPTQQSCPSCGMTSQSACRGERRDTSPVSTSSFRTLSDGSLPTACESQCARSLCVAQPYVQLTMFGLQTAKRC